MAVIEMASMVVDLLVEKWLLRLRIFVLSFALAAQQIMPAMITPITAPFRSTSWIMKTAWTWLRLLHPRSRLDPVVPVKFAIQLHTHVQAGRHIIVSVVIGP